MLVKLRKMADGRWKIQALSGELYGMDVGAADEVLLRRARFGIRHISGFVVSTCGLDIFSPETDLATIASLNEVASYGGRLDNTAVFRPEENGWWDVEDQTKPEPLYQVDRILAGVDLVTFCYESPGLTGSPVELPSTQKAPEKQGFWSRIFSR